MNRVLIIDDEPSICWGLTELLGEEGFESRAFGSAEEALDPGEDVAADLMLLDVRLPGQDGISAIPAMRRRYGNVPIVVMTAFGDLATAVRAVEAGATDYLCKPLDADAVTSVVKRSLVQTRRDDTPAVAQEIVPDGTLVGRAPAMQKVFKSIALAAAADVPVLVTGESGTGKELIARAIHQNSARRSRPFLPICLPALNPGLIESELFGHERGTFTGADANRVGLLEAAEGGSVFLDEVGDTPLDVQVKLLRALEYREIIPVGGVTPRRVDFRVIAATNQPLTSLVQSGQFRADLFYRLNVFVIEAPPLRERREYIPLLADLFLRRQDGSAMSRLDPQAIKELQGRPWHGNVRELRNVIEHAAVLARGQTICCEHLPAPSTASPEVARKQDARSLLASGIEEWIDESFPLPDTPEAANADLYNRFLGLVEKPLLEATLEKCGGNQTTAAAILGIHRSTLRQKLRDAGLR